MHSYATSSKVWNEDSLADVPREGAFRLRGLEVTRLDTFVDAAFAFVLTLLVISFDDIPSNYAEIIETVTKIPAFFSSFAVLMVFWLSHRNWSRRYGLENKATLLLSLAIIFTVLVYVYPLRMVFESGFNWMSDGFFTSTIEVNAFDELPLMFNFYSVGFLVMSSLFALLYRFTLLSREPLCLNEVEEAETRGHVRGWSVCAVMAVLSLIIANLAEGYWVTAAGWVYGFIYPVILLVDRIAARKAS